MKKTGIVGGIAWPSTVEYYSEICRRSAPSTPEIGIESLDLNRTLSYLGIDGDEKSWLRFDDYHRAALERLEAGGADFALMASNTPHDRFESITRGIAIPVIDIFEVTAKECARIGAREVLILGTALTMKSRRFRDAFAKHHIEAAGPSDKTSRALTTRLIAELQPGNAEGAAGRVGQIVKSACGHQINQKLVACLACTELPLAFPDRKSLATFAHDSVVYLNTAAVHIDAALDFLT